MLDLCERIVERMGGSWGIIGWSLFVITLIVPFMPGAPDAVPQPGVNPNPFIIPSAIRLGFAGLTVLWWIVDAIDQQVASWQVAVGVLMLGFGCLPRAGIIPIAAWVIYWIKVRE